MFLREAAHSRKIRNKIIDCFENASLPDVSDEEKRALLGFVVCGGGPTGVEFAAELHDFIEEDVKKKYPELVEFISVLLIEAGTKLLNTFDEKLSEYTMKIFGRQKIKVITKSYITKITDKCIFLNDGSTLHYGLLVWATGNTASELIASTDMPKNNKKKLIVNGHMEVKDNAGIYAIGDCSENAENPYPATAQVAQQEGLYLAKQLNKLAKGKQSKPFSFADFGMLAYVGSHKALANMKQYKGSGFATWIFWRSVYLTKLVSTKNKMLVLFDWFKNFLFGRDISNF
jgi:NADH:ubiquinone reductase (non-electrogenic)